MRKIFALLFMISTVLTAQQLITAEDAIKIGLENNFDIRIAKNNQEISKNNTGLGTAGFLPKLDATGNYNLGSTDTETNSPFSFGDTDSRSYGGRLSLSWTLFDGFRMFTNKRKYDELAQLGEFQARLTIENNVVNILRAYFNLVTQKTLLSIAKNTAEISKIRFDKTKVRDELGSVSSTDLLNAQVAYNSDKSSLINQELAVEIAKKDLILLLGLDQNKEIDVVDDIKADQYSLDKEQYSNAVFERNSALLTAKQNLEVSKADKDLAGSSYYPILSLSSGYGYNDSQTSRANNSTDINTKTYDATLGLNLSFNLFNGFRDKITRQNAIIGIKNSTLQLEKAKNNLQGLINEKYLTYQKRLEKLRFEESNIKAARQNLELQQDRLDRGTVNSLEFRDAQLNLARSENNLINARFQLKIAVLELKQLSGEIPVE
ncbi:MAG: membrane protein [Melioribacteraceae bacterium]|nr:MAG: membrane protein [Melioribacteraceae bacterium]